MLVDQKGEVLSPNLYKEQGSPLVIPKTGLLTPKDRVGVFFTPALDKFYRGHEKAMGRFSSIPFDEIDKSLVTDTDVMAVRWTMLIESHNPVYTRELLDYFVHDHEMAAFAAIWGYEELMHYAKLRTYLEAGQFVELKELDKELIETRAGPFGEQERQYNPIQFFTCTMLQEGVTARTYRYWSRHVKEPVLQKVFDTMGKDEMRHCQFYLDKAKGELKGKPKSLDEIDEVIVNFSMPGSTFIRNNEDYHCLLYTSPSPRD